MARVKFNNGDIIKIYLENGLYGYAIILLNFKQLQKLNLISETHPFSRLMTVPLLVRTFDILTKNQNIPFDELMNIPYKKCKFIFSKKVSNGEYQIVLHKDLTTDDVDFPYIYGVKSETCMSFSTHEEIIRHFERWPKENIEAYFSWGFGIIKTENNKLKKNLPNFLTKECGPSVGFGLNEYDFGQQPLTPYQLIKENDLQNVLKYFRLKTDITFDEFNKNNNGYTKDEILKIRNKK
jgi:hypothetical protein